MNQVRQEFTAPQTQENRNKVKADPNRLAYHLMPPVGWLNDPNGLCQFHDTYHIFYQYTPGNPTGQDHRGWGHYTTQDFIHYQEENDPFVPDHFGDLKGSYSGSALIQDDIMHLFYTGNNKLEGDYDYINSGRIHWVMHAMSQDGFHFTPKEVLLENKDYPQNLSCHVRDPKVIAYNHAYYMVVGARTKDSCGQAEIFKSSNLHDWTHVSTSCHVRDPKVIAYNHAYYMVVGARTKDSCGQAEIFKSSNLHDWTHVSTITPIQRFGYMWECPDLVELDGRLFLFTCPQGVDQVGYNYEAKYQNGYFELDRNLDIDQQVDLFHEQDHGFDFYAPQSFVDQAGRRILIGWMGLPDVDYTKPTIQQNWQHALTLPRLLTLHQNKILQYPISEIEGLRNKHIHFDIQENTIYTPGSVVWLTLPRLLTLHQNKILQYPISEIEGLRNKHIHFDIQENTIYTPGSVVCELQIRPQGNAWTLHLRKDCTITYDGKLFTLALGSSGYGRSSRHIEIDTIDSLSIWSDTSSLEIFINTITYDGKLFTLALGSSGYGRSSRHIEIDTIDSLSIWSDTSSLEIFINKGEYALTTQLFDGETEMRLSSDLGMDIDFYSYDHFEIREKVDKEDPTLA